MDWLWLILMGLVIGVVAKLLMPGKDPGGCVVTMLLGVAGALLAGVIGRMFNIYQPNEPAGFIGGVIGAMLILGVYRIATQKERKKKH